MRRKRQLTLEDHYNDLKRIYSIQNVVSCEIVGIHGWIRVRALERVAKELGLKIRSKDGEYRIKVRKDFGNTIEEVTYPTTTYWIGGPTVEELTPKKVEAPKIETAQPLPFGANTL